MEKRHQENNTGALKRFKGVDPRGTNPAGPDWKGAATVNGVSYWVSAWIKTWPEGEKMRVVFSEIDSAKADPPPPSQPAPPCTDPGLAGFEETANPPF